MYSDSPQKQTPPEDFYIDSSHETVQRLHHAYRHDFRYENSSIHNILQLFSEYLVIHHSVSTKSQQGQRRKSSEQGDGEKLN